MAEQAASKTQVQRTGSTHLNRPDSSLNAIISAFWIFFGIIRLSSPIPFKIECSSRSTNSTCQQI